MAAPPPPNSPLLNYAPPHFAINDHVIRIITEHMVDHAFSEWPTDRMVWAQITNHHQIGRPEPSNPTWRRNIEGLVNVNRGTTFDQAKVFIDLLSRWARQHGKGDVVECVVVNTPRYQEILDAYQRREHVPDLLLIYGATGPESGGRGHAALFIINFKHRKIFLVGTSSFKKYGEKAYDPSTEKGRGFRGNYVNFTNATIYLAANHQTLAAPVLTNIPWPLTTRYDWDHLDQLNIANYRANVPLATARIDRYVSIVRNMVFNDHFSYKYVTSEFQSGANLPRTQFYTECGYLTFWNMLITVLAPEAVRDGFFETDGQAHFFPFPLGDRVRWRVFIAEAIFRDSLPPWLVTPEVKAYIYHHFMRYHPLTDRMEPYYVEPRDPNEPWDVRPWQAPPIAPPAPPAPPPPLPQFDEEIEASIPASALSADRRMLIRNVIGAIKRADPKGRIGLLQHFVFTVAPERFGEAGKKYANLYSSLLDPLPIPDDEYIMTIEEIGFLNQAIIDFKKERGSSMKTFLVEYILENPHPEALYEEVEWLKSRFPKLEPPQRRPRSPPAGGSDFFSKRFYI